MLSVAPVDGHEQADQEQQPEQVDDQLVQNVEGALIEAQAEVGTHDVGFEQHDQGPDEQDDEPPEDEQVHEPRVDVPGPDQATVQERHGHRLAQALANTIDRTVGSPASPREIAPRAAVRQYQGLDRDQYVHHHEG